MTVSPNKTRKNMKTAAERFDALVKAENNRDNETSEERLKRLELSVKVCEDLYEDVQREGDAGTCVIATRLLRNAKSLLSCFQCLSV